MELAVCGAGGSIAVRDGCSPVGGPVADLGRGVEAALAVEVALIGNLTILGDVVERGVPEALPIC